MRRFAVEVFTLSAAAMLSLGCEGGEEPMQERWPDAGQGLAVVDAGPLFTTDASAVVVADANSLLPADANTASPSDAASPADAGMVQCETLDITRCSQQTACKVVLGLAYDPGAYCRAESETPLACRDFFAPCGGPKTRALDSSGKAWRLLDVCLPPGFKYAPEESQPASWIDDYPVCASDALQAMCAALDESTCAANAACVPLSGRRLNTLRSCKESSAGFAVCAQNTGCNTRPLYAKDPRSGASWELERDCLPMGWTALSESAADRARAYSTCTF